MADPTHAELLREYLTQLSEPGAEARLPQWKEWLKLRLGAPMALGAMLALTGCGGESDGHDNTGGQSGYTTAAAGANSGGQVSAVEGGASSGFSGAGNKYGIPMTSNGGASSSVNSSSTGGSATGGSGGVKYGMPLSGGTTNMTAGGAHNGGAATGGVGGVKYGMPLSGGATNMSAGGAHNGGTTAGVLYGGASPVVEYGVFMTAGNKPTNGGSGAVPTTGGATSKPPNDVTGGANVGLLYAAPMSGGSGTTGTSSAGSAATGSVATRYGVTMGS